MSKLSVAPLLPALLASAALAQQVHVVDAFGGPGSQYTQIYAAVDAAADGDVVLVREGVYVSFTIDGKGLEVVADHGAVVAVNGTAAIHNLGADQRVLLHGLDAETLTNGPGLLVADCQGSVWIEDGRFLGPQVLAQTGDPGARITGSSAVTLLRTELVGGRGLSTDAGAGLRAEGSNVFLFDVTATGGTGEAAVFPPSHASGAGVHGSGGMLRASGGALTGGQGGDGSLVFGCTDGVDGGPGLLLDGGASAVLLDVALAGGAGGDAVAPCLPGAAGASVDAAGGSLTQVPAAARHLSIPGPARPGETVTIVAEGAPGDLVVLLYAATHAPLALDSPILLGGPILPSLPGAMTPLGTTDAAGLLQVSFPAGVPPGQALTLYAQAAFVDPLLAQPAVIGAGQSLTFLASGF